MSWGSVELVYRTVSQQYVMEEMFVVGGMGDRGDCLVVEGWVDTDLFRVGVLLSDVVVARVVQSYVLF